jgi:Tol biopolymer transport system component
MKFKLFIWMAFLITLTGCNLNPNQIQIPLSATPINKLQISYLRNRVEQNFSEFYTMDIICMSRDKVCADKPKLLFRTLKMPNNEQNQPKGLLTDYSWSPNGTELALISAGDILVGNIVTQEWINVTNSPNIREFEPKWSSDGKSIYYIECIEDASGACTPHLVHFDPTAQKKQSLLGAWNRPITAHYDVSPDERIVLFAISGPLGISDLLYQANPDGTNSNQITVGDISENSPSFSPDGQKFAFVRSAILNSDDSEEQSDIILKDLVSGKEKNLTQKFDDLVFSPTFSPSGEWIVFNSFDSKPNVNIFLVSVVHESIIQITQGNEETSPAWRVFSEQ